MLAALDGRAPNFDGVRLLISIPEWPEYHQSSIVVLDPASRSAYPLPIDAYSGKINDQGVPVDEGVLEFSRDSNRLCINGAILAYRVIEQGRFCFRFVSGKFSGHRTPYMNAEVAK